MDSALEAERICEGAILKVREVLEAREILSNKEMAARMHEALEQPILMARFLETWLQFACVSFIILF